MSQVAPFLLGPPARMRRLREGLGLRLLSIALFVLLLLSLTTLLAAWFWLPDMLSFFRPHLFYLSVLLLAGTMVGRRRGWMFLAAGLVAFNAWPLMVQVMPLPQAPPPDAPTIRVMSANLLWDNPHTDRLQQAVAEVAPDILVVQEEAVRWRDAIAKLDQLPYRSRFTGVDVASRFPITARKVGLDIAHLRNAIGGQMALRAEIDPGAAGRPFVLYDIHPPTPRSLLGWQVRAAYLDAVSRLVAAEPPGTPVIVAGDWNTPTWSPLLRRFVDKTGLAPAAASPWPVPTRIFDLFGLPLPYWLGTPIDRIAVSRNVAVAGFHRGPAFGSDHLPVYADVVVR